MVALCPNCHAIKPAAGPASSSAPNSWKKRGGGTRPSRAVASYALRYSRQARFVRPALVDGTP
jgi:hypothetical protein